MFDWDDSELANILWDEATENGDHIVPYPKGSDESRNAKELKERDVGVKPDEQEEAGAKVDLNKKLPESHDGCSASGIGIESWVDLPPSASHAALEPVNNDEREPNDADEIPKYDTARDQQEDEDAEIYQSSKEGKEQGDFVDYSWANIGSFYDFDRIFSNDEAVFGHTSLDNAEGLWPSSRDVGECSGKSVPFSSDLCGVVPESKSNNKYRHLKVKTEFVQTDDPSCSLSYGEIGNSASPSLHRVHRIINRGGDSASEISPVTKEETSLDMAKKSSVETSLIAAQNITNATKISDKIPVTSSQKKKKVLYHGLGGAIKLRKTGNGKENRNSGLGSPLARARKRRSKVRRQKKSTRSYKRVETKSKGNPPQEPYGPWSTTTGSPFQHFPPSAQQMQLIRPELYPYQHVSNQFMPHPFYGNPINPFPAMPVMSHIQPGQFNPNFLSTYNVSPSGSDIPANKSAESPLSHVTMTPQEKIEKLRRRQQFQAMLAIEKQQQQLRQQALLTKSCPQNQETDDLSVFSCLEPSSPLEQDGSNITSSVIEEYSVEETVLHRLQDIIANLDMTVRLCIRDSLFRLAQSARKRQSVIHTSKSGFWDEQEGLGKEEINSYSRSDDSETETNPTDRAIAHLLFHRPLELPGKPPESSEHLQSTKPHSESSPATNKQSLSGHESKVDAGEDCGNLSPQ